LKSGYRYRSTDDYEFYNVEAAVAALELRHEGLSLLEPFSEFSFSDVFRAALRFTEYR
jgi:hypothetical protein